MAWHGVVWRGVAWCGVAWYGEGRVWHGMVWCGVVWCGVHGVVCDTHSPIFSPFQHKWLLGTSLVSLQMDSGAVMKTEVTFRRQ